MRLSTNAFISESLSNISIRFGSSLEKLTLGVKINKASDDSSGLSISDNKESIVLSAGQFALTQANTYTQSIL